VAILFKKQVLHLASTTSFQTAFSVVLVVR